MDKSTSWVHPLYKTEQYLRYNQVIFDLVEIYRRRLQYELDRVNSLYEMEGRFNNIHKSCSDEIDQFHRESSGGQNINSIEHWEQRVNNELANHLDTDLPQWTNRNFGYAFYGGLGTSLMTGSIGDYFGPTFNLFFGFDLAYKKSILYLTGTIGGGKVMKDYFSDQNWYNNQSATLAVIDVSYGYALIDNATLKLSPFAGLGITEFTGENRDDAENGLRIVDYNAIFGLNADYKIKTKVKLVPNPYLGVKEKVETSVRVRLYMTRADFYSDLHGYTINLSVGICGFGNMVNLHK